MTPEQKLRYQDIFARYCLSVYKSIPLDFVGGINYEITTVNVDDKYAYVNSLIDIGNDQKFIVEFRLSKKDSKLKLVDIKLGESSLVLSYRNKIYQQLAELDEEIEWFLEDLEMQTISTEKQNEQKLLLNAK